MYTCMYAHLYSTNRTLRKLYSLELSLNLIHKYSFFRFACSPFSLTVFLARSLALSLSLFLSSLFYLLSLSLPSPLLSTLALHPLFSLLPLVASLSSPFSLPCPPLLSPLPFLDSPLSPSFSLSLFLDQTVSLPVSLSTCLSTPKTSGVT